MGGRRVQSSSSSRPAATPGASASGTSASGGLAVSLTLLRAAICATVAVAYHNAIGCDFVHDDVFAVVNNPDVHDGVAGRAPSSFLALWGNDFWGTPIRSELSHKSYRPLTVASFRLNSLLLGGPDARAFHGANVVLHALASVLVFELCRQHLLRRAADGAGTLLSFLTALLFAAHPIHVEAVTGVVGRAELLALLLSLAALFVQASLVTNQHTPRTRSSGLLGLPARAWVAVLTAAAMLCKEQAIMTLPVCVAFDFFYSADLAYTTLAGSAYRALTSTRFVVDTAVYAAASVGLLGVRLAVAGGATGPNFSRQDNPASFAAEALTRALTYNHLYAFNAWLLVFPRSLCFDWQMDSIPLVTSLADPRNAGTLLLYCAGAAVVAAAASQWPAPAARAILFGVASGLLYFLPSSNLVFRVGFVVADRVLYLPSLGFCLAAPALLLLALRRLLPRASTAGARAATAGLVGLAVVAYCARAVARNGDWASRESLNLSGLEVNPRCGKCHYNLGNLYRDRGRPGLAANHYTEALRLWPSHASSLNNLGLLFEARGDTQGARRRYTQAIDAHPAHPTSYVNMGNLMRSAGQLELAIQYYQRAIKLSGPLRGLEARANLAGAYQTLGRLAEAGEAYDAVMRLGPRDPGILLNYAAFLRATGRAGDSLVLIRGVLGGHPGHAEAHLALVAGLAADGRHADAAQHWAGSAPPQLQASPDLLARFAAALSPTTPGAGRAAAEAAVRALRRALELNPGHAAAAGQLSRVLQAGDRHAEAEAVVRVAMRHSPTPSARLSNRLGHLLLEGGQGDAAARAFAEAADAAQAALATADQSPGGSADVPHHTNSLLNAASLLLSRDAARAEGYLEALLRADASNEQALILLSQAVRGRDPTAAEAHARRAAESGSAAAMAHLGAVLHAGPAGAKHAEALQWYDRALAIDPALANLADNRRKLQRTIRGQQPQQRRR